MQNTQHIPPQLMQHYQQQMMQQQQQLQQQQRPFHPQAAYPTMANLTPSNRTQGVFSKYAARLKHSDDNALLLPESYVTKKTRFTGNESDDEFNEMMEESDDEEEEEEGGGGAGGGEGEVNSGANGTDKKQTEEKTRTIPLPGSAVAPPVDNNPAVIRKKNNFFYSVLDLKNISEIDEILVPVRLDIDVDSVKLRDRFLWNMNGKIKGVTWIVKRETIGITPFFLEQYLTPEKFGEMLCDDLELPHSRFIQPIADSIRAQVLDFESFSEVKLPSENTRVVIKVRKVRQTQEKEKAY